MAKRFAKVERDFYCNPDYSIYDKLVYSVAQFFSYNNDTRNINISHQSKVCGMSRNRFKKSLKLLIAEGIIVDTSYGYRFMRSERTPFVKADYRVISDPKLKTMGKCLYFVLRSMCIKTNMCWPLRQTLADYLNVSISSIKRALKALSIRELIKSIPYKYRYDRNAASVRKLQPLSTVYPKENKMALIEDDNAPVNQFSAESSDSIEDHVETNDDEKLATAAFVYNEYRKNFKKAFPKAHMSDKPSTKDLGLCKNYLLALPHKGEIRLYMEMLFGDFAAIKSQNKNYIQGDFVCLQKGLGLLKDYRTSIIDYKGVTTETHRVSCLNKYKVNNPVVESPTEQPEIVPQAPKPSKSNQVENKPAEKIELPEETKKEPVKSVGSQTILQSDGTIDYEAIDRLREEMKQVTNYVYNKDPDLYKDKTGEDYTDFELMYISGGELANFRSTASPEQLERYAKIKDAFFTRAKDALNA